MRNKKDFRLSPPSNSLFGGSLGPDDIVPVEDRIVLHGVAGLCWRLSFAKRMERLEIKNIL